MLSAVDNNCPINLVYSNVLVRYSYSVNLVYSNVFMLGTSANCYNMYCYFSSTTPTLVTLCVLNYPCIYVWNPFLVTTKARYSRTASQQHQPSLLCLRRMINPSIANATTTKRSLGDDKAYYCDQARTRDEHSNHKHMYHTQTLEPHGSNCTFTRRS